MTITTHRDAPCWEVIDAATGKPPEYGSGDGWAHFATREEAVLARDECAAEQAVDDAEHEKIRAQIGLAPNPNPARVLSVARSFGSPCKKIVCDGCTDEMDASGEGWTHFDPNEHPPMSADWSDIEWVERGDKHYHDDCAPPWCEDCEVEGHDVDDCTADGAA